MIDPIIEFFDRKFPFNKAGLKEFSDSFKTKHYPKNTILSSQGDAENQLRFIEEGTLREYYSHGGKEMNTWFYTQKEFITDFNLLLNGGVKRRSQECLSAVTIRTMDKHIFYQFMENYACGQEFVSRIFSAIISMREEHDFRHFSCSPDDLYLDLLSERSDWFQKVPLFHIASYLRMTPETLSRVRKRNLIS